MVVKEKKEVMEDLSKYFEMSDEELDDLASTSIASKDSTTTYMFEAGDIAGKVMVWDGGSATLSVKTKVVEGEKKGQGGPLLKLGLGPYVGKDETPNEDELAERTEKAAVRFYQMVKNVTDGALTQFTGESREEVLTDLAGILEGQRFIGIVAKRDDSGFAKFSRVYALSNPPKSYTPEVEAFSL